MRSCCPSAGPLRSALFSPPGRISVLRSPAADALFVSLATLSHRRAGPSARQVHAGELQRQRHEHEDARRKPETPDLFDGKDVEQVEQAFHDGVGYEKRTPAGCV